MKPRSAHQRRYLSSSPFQPAPDQVIEDFALGERVSHDRYGMGQIVSKEDAAVTVNFGNQVVRIVSPFDKLEKL